MNLHIASFHEGKKNMIFVKFAPRQKLVWRDTVYQFMKIRKKQIQWHNLCHDLYNQGFLKKSYLINSWAKESFQNVTIVMLKILSDFSGPCRLKGFSVLFSNSNPIKSIIAKFHAHGQINKAWNCAQIKGKCMCVTKLMHFKKGTSVLN